MQKYLIFYINQIFKQLILINLKIFKLPLLIIKTFVVNAVGYSDEITQSKQRDKKVNELHVTKKL